MNTTHRITHNVPELTWPKEPFLPGDRYAALTPKCPTGVRRAVYLITKDGSCHDLIPGRVEPLLIGTTMSRVVKSPQETKHGVICYL